MGGVDGDCVGRFQVGLEWTERATYFGCASWMFAVVWSYVHPVCMAVVTTDQDEDGGARVQ